MARAIQAAAHLKVRHGIACSIRRSPSWRHFNGHPSSPLRLDLPRGPYIARKQLPKPYRPGLKSIFPFSFFLPLSQVKRQCGNNREV